MIKNNFFDVNVPKVIVSQDSHILYASRAAIPYNKKKKNLLKLGDKYVHMPSQRKNCSFFPQKKRKTPIENIEDLEYLRFLELGMKLRALKMSKKSIAVDIKEDLVFSK